MSVGHEDELRRMAGLVTPMSLRVAVTLRLPDRLLGDGAATDRLADELHVSPVALGLLLGHLESLGVVERTGSGHRTTAYGAALCADGDLARFLHLDTAAGRAELAFVELAHSVTTGRDAYSRRYGRDFWADLAEHPHLRESFDQQMVHRFREQLPMMVTGFDWSRFATVVDVGGGRGTLLAAVLTANPGMHGHVVDVAATAAGAEQTFLANDLGDRTEVTAGSFFDPLPPGADAYVLFDILHNWDDDHAGGILARCAEAAPPGGRVLVIEAAGGAGSTGTEMDLTMLVHYGGRDRSVDELRALAAPHGLALDSVTPLTDDRGVLEFRLTTGD